MINKTFVLGLFLTFFSQISQCENTDFDLEIKPGKDGLPLGWKLMNKSVSPSDFKVIKQDNGFIIKATPKAGKGSVSLLSKAYLVNGASEVQISMDFHGRGIAALTVWLMDKQKRHLSSLLCVSSKINGQHRSRTKKAIIPPKIKGLVPTYIILRLSVNRGSDITITDMNIVLSSGKQKEKNVEPANTLASPVKAVFNYGKDWETGVYWKTKTIGKRNFYLAESGNYLRVNPKGREMLYQVGLLDRIIPGHWNLKFFDPAVYAKSSPEIKKTVDEILCEEIPLPTVNYQMMKGNKGPNQASLKRVGHLWIGDGQPEEPIYRTEPIFYFMSTGKKWQGSSAHIWNNKHSIGYLKDKLMPALRKEIPGCDRPDFKWTREAYKKMCDIYVKTYLEINPRPMGFTMYLSPYMIAAKPKVKTVAAKAGDARNLAEQRGALRQAGGNKFTLNWRGHEPMERFAYIYHPARMNDPNRDCWGYSISHLKPYLYHPYLLGINYVSYETFAKTLISDIENDGRYRLSTLGNEVKKMLDLTEKIKDRGIVYTPVALIRGWDREGCKRQRPYSGRIMLDDADNMNNALINDLLYPEHWASANTGEYSCYAPYGELFDILRPDYTKPVDPNIFDGYKLLFMLGGVKLSPQYADALKQQVKEGKILVINAADALNLKKYLGPDLLGVKIASTAQTGNTLTETATNHTFKEGSFKWYELTPDKNTKILYLCNKKPIISLHKYGKGAVVVVGVRYMQKVKKELHLDRRHKERIMRKKLLNFVPHFLESLTQGITPFEVKLTPEARKNLAWLVKKTQKGWRVIVFNYDVERDNKLHRVGTACFHVLHPYKETPFEIICNAPMKDVVELTEGRDVNLKNENNKMVVREKVAGGQILIYDFQPGKIKLPPYKRYVNYALRKPVKASSSEGDLVPSLAVDGDESNDNYWASGYSGGRYGYKLPASLEIDLGGVKTINHIWIKFHTWQFRNIDYRRTIYKYIIESSLNGKNWKKIVDESGNWDDAVPDGIETWFQPVEAKFVKLTVLDNTSYAGARICEIKIMGSEKELFQPKRKSIRPKWQVEFPDKVNQAKRIRLLRNLEPAAKPEIGWMPSGKTWKQLNGWVKLYTNLNAEDGLTCPQSLYAEAPSEIVYTIPNNAEYFATVPGLGNRHRQASVEFRIFVDGVKKYDSGYFKVGNPLDAVVINVTGAKKLKLVVTDGGNGLAYDYSWWGDARFILK